MQRSIKSIKEERARGTRRVDDDASSLSESEVGLGRRERERFDQPLLVLDSASAYIRQAGKELME